MIDKPRSKTLEEAIAAAYEVRYQAEAEARGRYEKALLRYDEAVREQDEARQKLDRMRRQLDKDVDVFFGTLLVSILVGLIIVLVVVVFSIWRIS
jgi:hypothetical protein